MTRVCRINGIWFTSALSAEDWGWVEAQCQSGLRRLWTPRHDGSETIVFWPEAGDPATPTLRAIRRHDGRCEIRDADHRLMGAGRSLGEAQARAQRMRLLDPGVPRAA